MDREKRRIYRTNLMLQEGLLQLLEHKRLDEIHVTELCRASGVNRATFYRHYTSTGDILTELETLMTEELGQIAPQPQNMEGLKLYLEQYCRCIRAHAKSIRLLIRCHSTSKLTGQVTEWCCGIVRFMDEAERCCGETGDSAGWDMVTAFLAGGVCFLLHKWILRGCEETPEQVVEIVMDLIRKESDFCSECCRAERKGQDQ